MRYPHDSDNQRWCVVLAGVKTKGSWDDARLPEPQKKTPPNAIANRRSRNREEANCYNDLKAEVKTLKDKEDDWEHRSPKK